ncbi:MAG: carbohydrate binding domain-containing protein, partial [Anaerolineae bacterium]
IPLAAFTKIADWLAMEKLFIAFEEGIGSGAGTIYLDDIKFEEAPIVPIAVDNFNDMTGENGLGGGLWADAGNGATIDAAHDPVNAYGNTGAGYRISYSGVTEYGWAAFGTNLVGLDASDCAALSFHIKGANGGEKPNVYLSDGTIESFVNIEDHIIVTTSWQRVDILLEDFAAKGIDFANLAYFQVIFEWEGMEGTVYLDNIQFGSIFGDLDWDCIVDVADIMMVASHWRCRCGDVCYDSLYDLDGDCDIDIVDIMLVVVHWGETC